MTSDAGRRCTTTGFHLLPASAYPVAWRVAKDEYVNSAGINSVLEVSTVGPLPPDSEDTRSRFDTIGHTVYYGDTPKTALAESLQDFRRKKVAVAADAQAIGMDVDDYITAVFTDADKRGIDRPWTVGFDWQYARSIHRVRMPKHGWWVDVQHSDTLNRLSLDLADRMSRFNLPDVDLSTVTGRDRAVTTLIAQHIRDAVLYDGTLPLGIVFPSKLGYGQNFAWWDRRNDDGLTPGADDPSSVESFNVCMPGAWDEVLSDLGLEHPFTKD